MKILDIDWAKSFLFPLLLINPQTIILYHFFVVALRPNAGHGILILEVF